MDVVESYLLPLSHNIPDLQLWKFDFSPSTNPKHVWISLPHGVQIVSGKKSLLPAKSRFLGRINILSWGEECSVNGERITPFQRDQLVCIETRSSDHQSQILWIDINQPAVVITPSGNKEVVDVRNPSKPLPGSQIFGWLSGLEIASSKPQLIRKECFLVPVDFSIRDDVAVVLSSHAGLSNGESGNMADPKPGKVIVVNPQSEDLYSYPYGSMESSQTSSSMETTESLHEGEFLREMRGDLEFPAFMMNEETGDRDTNLSETLVEMEDLFNRVVWTLQNELEDGGSNPTRDNTIEAQRERIEMQLEEMKNFEEEPQSNGSNRPLSLLEKLLAILTCILEIGEKVDAHRRVDNPLLLQLVKNQLPKLTSWMNDQSKDEHSRLQLARDTLSQLVNIQSALTCFTWTDQSELDIESSISDARLLLNSCIEREINKKLEDKPTDDRLRFNINNVLSNFIETLNECLSKISSTKVSLERGNFNLQQLSADLSVNATFLKSNCAWISCLLDEEVLERLGISRRNYNNLKVLYERALKTYSHLVIRSRMVCEQSGLQDLTSRLTRILEESSKGMLNRWKICQLEKELDSCEAECVFEVLTNADNYNGFIQDVIFQLRQSIVKIRRNLNEVEIKQESFVEEFSGRLNAAISRSNGSTSPKSSFESLLSGWYLQTTSTTSNQVNELIGQLERNVSESLLSPLTADDCVSQLENFIRRIPSTVPSNAEALSLRETLLIVSDIIHRGNAAVQLLERLAFLMNLNTTQRLQELRCAYPRAVESLSLCFQALEGVLREFLEWRNTLMLVPDSDEVDISTQAVIESTNFAMDVLTQETAHTGIIGFINVPDFLAKTLAWLSSLPSYLISFPDAFEESRLENSTEFKQADAILHQILDLEWHLADSSIAIRNDLSREIAEEQWKLQSSFTSDIKDLKNSVYIMKKGTLMDPKVSFGRSARSRNSSYFHVLAGSREMNKELNGFSIVNFIVSRAEALQKIDIAKLGEEISKGFGDKYPKWRLDSFFEQMKLIYDEYKQISQNEKIIEGDQNIAECLGKLQFLSGIGNKWVSFLEHPPYVMNRIVCCYWPEAIKRLISTYQSQADPISSTVWLKKAIELRNVVAKSLVPQHLDPSGFQQNRILIEDSFKNLRKSIKDTENILSKVPFDFKLDFEDVLQACSKLRDIAESYSTQLHEHIKNLTLYSLPKVKRDFQHLEDNLNELVTNRTSGLSLEECSNRVVELERRLQTMRHLSRVLFTCLAARSKSSLIAQPSEQLEVNELYSRAVKVVRDYEASELGRQIVEAWKKLQEIADKLGRFQAGLPIKEVFTQAEMETDQSSAGKIHMEEYTNASMARKRDWTLLEVLGSHDCLYPECRGRKRDRHCEPNEDDTILQDIHTFYSFLCSDLNKHASRIPCTIQTFGSNKTTSSEFVLTKLREEWHHDIDVVNQFKNLQRRVQLTSGEDSDIKSTFNLVENLWGRPDTPKFVAESTRKLATVSSWVCEVEEQMELVILQRLHAAWKTPPRTDPLPVVEECVYKMNEIAEDLGRLQRSEMIAERDLQVIRHSLRAGWFSVREYLLIRCNKLTSDSARYFPLVDDFVHHSAGLGFNDCNLLNIYSRLCGQFLLKGPRQRRPSRSQPVGRKFCSTKRSLRSLFLPYWLTERCRLMNDRPPVALTIHSLPDLSSEAYSTIEPTFHSPRCMSINSRRWMSQPELRPKPQTVHRRRVENSFSVVDEDAETIISPLNGLHDSRMNTFGISFFSSLSDEGKEDAKSPVDKEYQIRKPELGDTPATPKKSSPTELHSNPVNRAPVPSRKTRDKSPVTWCTVYLPNDEETGSLIYSELVPPQRRVVEIADDPLVPKREIYTPMVFSAPFEGSDEDVTEEEDLENAECGPSITEDSEICDWLRAQQAQNIQRLLQEYGDGNDEDMSLMEVDDQVSCTSPRPDIVYQRNKNGVSVSFEESGLGEEEWSRKSLEVTSLDKDGHSPTENSEGHVIWGPIVERPASPHLSVISEAPTDESALGKQGTIEYLQLSSEEASGDENVNSSEEWRGIYSSVSPHLQTVDDLVIHGRQLKLYPSLDDAGLTDTSTPIARSFEDKNKALFPLFMNLNSQESGESDEEAERTISAFLSPVDDMDSNDWLTYPNVFDVGQSGNDLNFDFKEQPDAKEYYILKPFQIDSTNPKSFKESVSLPNIEVKSSVKSKYLDIRQYEGDLDFKDVAVASDDEQKPTNYFRVPGAPSSTISTEEHDEATPSSSWMTIPSKSPIEQEIDNDDVGSRQIDEDSLEENELEDSLQESEVFLDEDDLNDTQGNAFLLQRSEMILNEPDILEAGMLRTSKERTNKSQVIVMEIPSSDLSDDSSEWLEPRSRKSKARKAKHSEGKASKKDETKTEKSDALEGNLPKSSWKERSDEMLEELEELQHLSEPEERKLDDSHPGAPDTSSLRADVSHEGLSQLDKVVDDRQCAILKEEFILPIREKDEEVMEAIPAEKTDNQLHDNEEEDKMTTNDEMLHEPSISKRGPVTEIEDLQPPGNEPITTNASTSLDSTNWKESKPMKKKGRKTKISKNQDFNAGKLKSHETIEMSQSKSRSPLEESDESQQGISSGNVALEKFDQISSGDSNFSVIKESLDIEPNQSFDASINEDVTNFKEVEFIPTIPNCIEFLDDIFPESVALKKENKDVVEDHRKLEEGITPTDINEKVSQHPEISSNKSEIIGASNFQESIIGQKESIQDIQWTSKDDMCLEAPSGVLSDEPDRWTDTKSKKGKGREKKKSDGVKDNTAQLTANDIQVTSSDEEIQLMGPSTNAIPGFEGPIDPNMVKSDKYSSSDLKTTDEVIESMEPEGDLSKIDESNVIDWADETPVETAFDMEVSQEYGLPFPEEEFISGFQDSDGKAIELTEIPPPDYKERTVESPLTSGDNLSLGNLSDSNLNERNRWFDAKSNILYDLGELKPSADVAEEKTSPLISKISNEMPEVLEGRLPTSAINLPRSYIEDDGKELDRASFEGNTEPKLKEAIPSPEKDSGKRTRKTTTDNIETLTINIPGADMLSKADQCETADPGNQQSDNKVDLSRHSTDGVFDSSLLHSSTESKETMQSEPIAHDDSPAGNTHLHKHSEDSGPGSDELLSISKEIDDTKPTASVCASEHQEPHGHSSEILPESTLRRSRTEETVEPESLISNKASSRKKTKREKNRTSKKGASQKTTQVDENITPNIAQLEAISESQNTTSQSRKRKRKSKSKKERDTKEKPVYESQFADFLAKPSSFEEQSDQQSDSTLKQVSQDDEEELAGYPTLEMGLYDVPRRIHSGDFSLYHDSDCYVENPLAVGGFLNGASEIDDYEDQLKKPYFESSESLPSEYQSEPYGTLDFHTEEHIASKGSPKYKGRSDSTQEKPSSSKTFIQLDDTKHPVMQSVTLLTKPTTVIKEYLPIRDGELADKLVDFEEVSKDLGELDTWKSQKMNAILPVLLSAEGRQQFETSQVPIDDLSKKVKEDVETPTASEPESSQGHGGKKRPSPQSEISQNSSITMPELEPGQEVEHKNEVVELRPEISATVSDEVEQGSPSSSIEVISSVDLEAGTNLQEITTIPSDESIEYGQHSEMKDEEFREYPPDELSFTILEKPPEGVRVELGPVYEDIEKKIVHEPFIIPSSSLKVSVERSRCRVSSFLIPLFLLLFFLVPFLLLLCVVNPDYCAMPGPCPGLDMRRRINYYILEFHRRRSPHYPI